MQHVSKQTLDDIIEREKMYRQIVEYSVESIIIHADHKVLYINQSGANFLRGNKEEINGAYLLDRIQEDYRDMIKERIQYVMTENKPAELIEHTIIRLDGTLVDVELNCNPVIYGNKRAVQTVYRDITKRREAEKKFKEIENEINQISAPIVPVLKDIAVLPLVGSICEDRAKHLLESIPSKLELQTVKWLIIDFSGIYKLDTMVIDYLFRINSVLRYIGVHTIMTGIRPDLAQKVVHLGLSSLPMQTMGTVKQALEYLQFNE